MNYLDLLQPKNNTSGLSDLRLMLTDVELANGTTTQMISVFNVKDIGFEEVLIGIKKTLEFAPDTKTMQPRLFNIHNNGELQEWGRFLYKQDIQHNFMQYQN